MGFQGTGYAICIPVPLLWCILWRMKTEGAWYNRVVERSWLDPIEPAHRIDCRHPWPARVDSRLSGGVNCYEPDRELVAELGDNDALLRCMVRDNTSWNEQVAKWSLSEGYRQFMDLGSGYPANDDVYERAEGRLSIFVVYADIDRSVWAHLRTSRDTHLGKYAHVHDDIAEADSILALPEVQETLDFTKPVVLILSSVLQFLSDDEARAAVAAYTAAVAPGSALVLSHPADGHPAVQALAEAYHDSGIPFQPRSHDEVAAFFDGWELCGPSGLCSTPEWRVPGAAKPKSRPRRGRYGVDPGMTAYAGVAIKPGSMRA
ncbi:SAM-dependent methyltransferase [Streptomyces tubercidicus]|uniref:SAM-dependent methyltransferase n=1 Tax=Streptomyces tubercidicus TaxID=47759 RepID=UPI0036920DC5